MSSSTGNAIFNGFTAEQFQAVMAMVSLMQAGSNQPLNQTQTTNPPLNQTHQTQTVNQPLNQTQTVNQPLDQTHQTQTVNQPLNQTQTVNQPLDQTHQTQTVNQPLNQTPAAESDANYQPLNQTQTVNQPLNQTKTVNQPLNQAQTVNQPMNQTQTVGQPMNQTQTVGHPPIQTQTVSATESDANRESESDANISIISSSANDQTENRETVEPSTFKIENLKSLKQHMEEAFDYVKAVKNKEVVPAQARIRSLDLLTDCLDTIVGYCCFICDGPPSPKRRKMSLSAAPTSLDTSGVFSQGALDTSGVFSEGAESQQLVTPTPPNPYAGTTVAITGAFAKASSVYSNKNLPSYRAMIQNLNTGANSGALMNQNTGALLNQNSNLSTLSNPNPAPTLSDPSQTVTYVIKENLRVSADEYDPGLQSRVVCGKDIGWVLNVCVPLSDNAILPGYGACSWLHIKSLCAQGFLSKGLTSFISKHASQDFYSMTDPQLGSFGYDIIQGFRKSLNSPLVPRDIYGAGSKPLVDSYDSDDDVWRRCKARTEAAKLSRA